MASDDKTALSNLEKATQSLNNAAKKLDSATNDLSNTGVENLTKSIKGVLKKFDMMSDAQSAAITDFKSLSAHVEDLEDQFVDVIKLEKSLKAKMKERIEVEGLGAKAAEEIMKEERRQALQVRGLTEQEISQIKLKIPLLRQEIDAHGKSIKAKDKLSREFDSLGKNIKGQIGRFTSFGYGLDLLTKGVKESYDQLHLLSSKGLLGSLSSMVVVSKRLMMTTKEFEEVISKNRDLVLAFGGGAKGVEMFGHVVADATKGLEYLGKEGPKVAARLVEMQKNIGLTVKDGKAYNDEMNASREQFKLFSGLFGDSAEQYATLMEAQANEETMRRKLNGLSKQQIASQMAEIRERTQNLKLLGLSNEQIVEFNKRTAEMNNPRKSGQIAKRLKEGTASQNSLEMMLQDIDPNSKEGKALAAQKKNLSEYFKAYQNNDQKRMGDLEKNNPEMLKALSGGRTWIDQNKDQFQRESHLRMAEKGGDIFGLATSKGDALNTAQAQGKAVPKEQWEEVKKAAMDMVMGLDPILGDLGTKFAELTKIVETLNAVLNDSFIKPILGIGIMALSVVGTLKLFGGGLASAGKLAGGALGTFSRMVSSVWGGISKLLAPLGLLKTAWDVGNTDTEDYKKRFGMEGSDTGFFGDLGIRGLGAASDLGNAMTFGLAGNFFRDKQEKEEKEKNGTAPAPAAAKPSAPTSIASKADSIPLKSSNPLTPPKAENIHAQAERRRLEASIPPGMTAPAPKTMTPAPAMSQTPKAMTPKKGNAAAGERKAALEVVMNERGMTDPKERAAFLAQMDHESGGFRYMTELGGDDYFKKYDGRRNLGNTQQGDGARYKGRGYIQLTGRANYEKYGKMIGQDLINNPELAAEPAIASQIAMAYWNDRGLGKKARAGDFDGVTKGINGGFNGKADRDQKFQKYLAEQKTVAGGGSTTPMTAPNFVNGPSSAIKGPASADSSMGPPAPVVNVTPDDKQAAELKRQTDILEKIASNTGQRNRSDNYQSNPAAVAPNAVA